MIELVKKSMKDAALKKNVWEYQLEMSSFQGLIKKVPKNTETTFWFLTNSC